MLTRLNAQLVEMIRNAENVLTPELCALQAVRACVRHGVPHYAVGRARDRARRYPYTHECEPGRDHEMDECLRDRSASVGHVYLRSF